MSEKKEILTTGKAKSLYTTSDPSKLIMEYRDDTSAFDGKKIEKLAGKGTVNNRFNAFIMEHLESEGVKTHFISQISDIEPPTFEFFYKDDDLGDPMINEYHINSFGWGTEQDVEEMKILTLKVNEILSKLFLQADLILVDFKLEFGRQDGVMYLGDEMTPDGCRVWDKETRKKLDKDRFRQGLGDVIESYQEIASRIGIDLK